MEGFAFIQAEGDIVDGLEFANDVERGGQISIGPFGGVGQVDKDQFTFGVFARFKLAEDFLPEGREVRKHGPVDHPDKVGLVPKFLEVGFADPFFDIFPTDFVNGAVLAEHEFAVGEFVGGGQAGIGDGVDFGPFGELVKNGVGLGMAEHADIFDGSAEGAHREGHDRSVAADFLGGRDDFKIGTFSSGGIDPLAELLHGGEGCVFGGGLALVDDLKNGVDKAVKAKQTFIFKKLSAGSDETFRCLAS